MKVHARMVTILRIKNVSGIQPNALKSRKITNALMSQIKPIVLHWTNANGIPPASRKLVLTKGALPLPPTRNREPGNGTSARLIPLASMEPSLI